MNATTVSLAIAGSRSELGVSWNKLFDWSKQPSTQQGLSLLLGGAVLAWLHPFPAAEGVAATIIAASLPKLWPDNTTDAIRNQALATAIAHAATTHKTADFEQVAVTAIGSLETVKA